MDNLKEYIQLSEAVSKNILNDILDVFLNEGESAARTAWLGVPINNAVSVNSSFSAEIGLDSGVGVMWYLDGGKGKMAAIYSYGGGGVNKVLTHDPKYMNKLLKDLKEFL